MIKRYEYNENFGITECQSEGEWVKYKDIKHLLERSDKSDYAKCTDEICELIYSCNSELTRKSIENVIKKHFA